MLNPCCYLQRKHGTLSYDQPEEPDTEVFIGLYCEHPKASKTDQPLEPEQARKCWNVAAEGCPCSLL